MSLAHEEHTIWQGGPSQLTNLAAFALCALTCFLIVPVFIGLWKWLAVRCHRYEITNQRVKETTGVLSKRLEELELYRVKDTRVVEPFLLRLFSRGNVVLSTSDRSHPTFVLAAVPNARMLREEIRGHVEKLRERKRVREVDYE